MQCRVNGNYDILIFLNIYVFLLTTNIQCYVNKLCKVYMSSNKFQSFDKMFR